MSQQMLAILTSKLDELAAYGEVDVETQRNVLKEELQYYVLDFIYHHPRYGTWIMYGGSALRLCHGLDRMSVDLDFEIPDTITDNFLNSLKSEVESHFVSAYTTKPGFLTFKIISGRGLLLRFHIGDALGMGHPSKQVHVKIDLNHFATPKTKIDRWPINRGQLSFVITTYPMSTLMASKIAAIFLRGTRGVGKDFFEEKGRDIYDLLWYMGKKVVPDLDYLIAKGVDVKDPKSLFDKLTVQMNGVSDESLAHDLKPLFVNQAFIENWLKNWRESYVRLLERYEIHTVTMLESVEVRHPNTSTRDSLVYVYKTEDKESVQVEYHMSNGWFKFIEGDIPVQINAAVIAHTKGSGNLTTKDKQYATLFYNKTEEYLKKTNRIMIGDIITTKLIRRTADNLNRKEEILLDRSALLSCDLDDLLK